MPPGEEMFKYHGASGPCPTMPLPAPEVPAGGALLYACNACEWVGEWVNTVHPKHDPNHLLCPECNETIHPYTVAMIAAAIRKPEVSDE